MLTITATFDLTSLYFVAASVVAILIYVLVRKHQARRKRRDRDAICDAAAEFFRASGEQATVECTTGADGKHFVALIDSMPSKRFRYSHIVAAILAGQVRKTTGLELERVYWRFPIKAVSEASPEPRPAAEAPGVPAPSDQYLDDGLALLKDLPQYEVTESSWDKFKELVDHTPTGR